MTRLEQQLVFSRELDRLKAVLRQSRLMDASRRENSAEHSWHLATLAIVMREHAAEPIDLARVLQMLLVHDVVEIDAGDTFVYDTVNTATQGDRERRAADRLFGLLPDDQGRELRALWEEFEARETADAKYARALDRLQPLMQNIGAGGVSWREHGVTQDRVIANMEAVRVGMPGLWPTVLKMISDAVAAGILAR